MEFGPRALGNRSILGDARSENMQKILNLKVKFRESFRPFAPSIIREDLTTWFNLNCDSPYMLLVSDIASDKRREMTEKEKALFGIDKAAGEKKKATRTTGSSCWSCALTIR